MDSLTREERGLLVASTAPVVASLAAFAIAAATTPFGFDRPVLGAVVLTVVAAGLAGGRPAALVTAAMGSLSFDFFHVAPLRVLHARTLAEVAALLVAVALVSGRQTLASRV